ncbi:PREDICTED: uncharacterized protein LOC109235826 [Nicotiana attenuata]|uniref:uncharacterized protein LOC109235826 n=1 Tax=Nicotiana attenuata TaxID=49451 RepID=UPI000905BF49|nr:PREDICTED: uncharacterized protein LOC109235826 [Nicotiana attenuata]
MASMMGKPLYTDKFTAHYEKISYARVLVEMDVAYPFLDQLEIESPFGPMVQTIDCNEEDDNKEMGKPRRKKRGAKKPTRIVKQTWLVKKPEVNAETEPEPLRKEALQADPAHEPDCTEMVRKSIEHVQQKIPMPYHTKDGVNPQNDICCNLVSEILASNDKGKAIAELRGLNQTHKQKEVKTFLAKNKVDVMGRIETRVKEHKAKKIQKKIAQGWNVYCNYPYAENGRIWILWSAHIQLQIIQTTYQFIHCLVEDSITQITSYLGTIYAQNDGHQRDTLWRDITQINMQAQEPWRLSEDFNNLLSYEDRIGSPVTIAETRRFKDVIDFYSLPLLELKDGI